MYNLHTVILWFFVINTIKEVSEALPSSYFWYTAGYYHLFDFGSDSNDDSGPPVDPLPKATEQDDADAEKIVNSNYDEKVIASILPFREPIHRQVINVEIEYYSHGNRLIPENYLPNHRKNSIFKDVCFALVNDPLTVLAMYLGEFLHRRDETFIIMALTLCQQMGEMHYIYNQRHKNGLTKRRRKQRHPFANLMKVWLAQDRQPQNCTFTKQDITKDANSLKNEYPNWDKTRDSLENILIKKCLKFSLAVLQTFEADLKTNIDEAIKEKIKNHDLVDAYTSLAHYVKDRNNYMATILLNHSNGSDRWAIWIMMIGFTNPDDWTQIDDAFKKINNDESLRDHILKVAEPDRIPFEIMAVMIDPKYKPPFH